MVPPPEGPLLAPALMGAAITGFVPPLGDGPLFVPTVEGGLGPVFVPGLEALGGG